MDGGAIKAHLCAAGNIRAMPETVLLAMSEKYYCTQKPLFLPIRRKNIFRNKSAGNTKTANRSVIFSSSKLNGTVRNTEPPRYIKSICTVSISAMINIKVLFLDSLLSRNIRSVRALKQ